MVNIYSLEKEERPYVEESTNVYSSGTAVLERPEEGLVKIVSKAPRKVLDEPKCRIILDEPVPYIIDGCCCPCPPVLNAGPFLLFGPLQ